MWLQAKGVSCPFILNQIKGGFLSHWCILRCLPSRTKRPTLNLTLAMRNLPWRDRRWQWHIWRIQTTSPWSSSTKWLSRSPWYIVLFYRNRNQKLHQCQGNTESLQVMQVSISFLIATPPSNKPAVNITALIRTRSQGLSAIISTRHPWPPGTSANTFTYCMGRCTMWQTRSTTGITSPRCKWTMHPLMPALVT